MHEKTLELYFTRFGVMVRPILYTMGLDYNRVYYSVDSVLMDFRVNGWIESKREGEMLGKEGMLVTFAKSI